MNVSDRIAVIYDGQIVDTLDPLQTNEQELGLLMAGQTKKGALTNQAEGEGSSHV
jgi:simple sugar transport system ATP-binding protein